MGRISRIVSKGGPVWVGIYGLSAAFITYFCMYAFRKPFAVATYEGVAGWPFDIDFKVAIVIAQVAGYASSKLLGIKFVSEAHPRWRTQMILGFITFSLLSLVAFAIVPSPWKVVAIFASGLPLGMIWGLVYGYLEGRRASEILGAGLTISFIVSSGFVKSVGRALIVDYHVPELWMPALTGLLFLPLLALSLFFLGQTPPPDARDVVERMVRTPMFKAERKAFVAATGFGLLMLILAYIVLTALRDFRDNFAVEIWGGLGFANAPAIFSLTELPIGLIVMIIFGLTMFIKDNRHAVLVYHGLIFVGALLVAGATYAFQSHVISPIGWMTLSGIGIYMGYVPFNCVLVDRMTAAFKYPGNAAFFMYLADSSGYVGSVGLLLVKHFGHLNLSWLNFFINICYFAAAVVTICVLMASVYFFKRLYPTTRSV